MKIDYEAEAETVEAIIEMLTDDDRYWSGLDKRVESLERIVANLLRDHAHELRMKSLDQENAE